MFHKDERSNQKRWRGDPGSLSNQEEISEETSKKDKQLTKKNKQRNNWFYEQNNRSQLLKRWITLST